MHKISVGEDRFEGFHTEMLYNLNLSFILTHINAHCTAHLWVTVTQNRNALRWRHNERDGISNHQPHHCLLNRLYWRISKKSSKLRVTGLCEGNSPVTGEFPAQRASSVENVSIWCCHHARWSTGFMLRQESRPIYHCKRFIYNHYIRFISNQSDF